MPVDIREKGRNRAGKTKQVVYQMGQDGELLLSREDKAPVKPCLPTGYRLYLKYYFK